MKLHSHYITVDPLYHVINRFINQFIAT